MVTWYNSVTGNIEQILTGCADEANKITKTPVRLIDRVTWKFARNKIEHSITVLTSDGCHVKNGNEYIRLDECDSGTEGSRYLIEMFDAGSDKRTRTGLLNKDEIAGTVNRIVAEKMCKSFVLNEADYWGVYTITKDRKRVDRINMGSHDSTYEKPDFITAPQYK